MPTRVLLVHSGGFTSRQWRRLAAELAPTHEVIAPDLIGYGDGPRWPDGAPFHFREDVAGLIARLDAAPGAGPAHVVGHSYGGLLALQVALARPALVRSLALYEPVAFGVLDPIEDADALASLREVGAPYALGPDGAADDAWLAAFVEWWNGPGAWAALGDDTRGAFRAVGWKLSQEVASLVADRTDRATYGAIAAPTLLLGGERSPMTEQRVLARLAAALPRAELRRIDAAGHMGPITHAAAVNAAIAAHVRANP
ncbi:MAG: alpha/beta hydrolase [Deltaproteobacteria bacterium]|nr:alpha/beta hydrolase [Deltaproteobacteria bacterium]